MTHYTFSREDINALRKTVDRKHPSYGGIQVRQGYLASTNGYVIQALPRHHLASYPGPNIRIDVPRKLRADAHEVLSLDLDKKQAQIVSLLEQGPEPTPVGYHMGSTLDFDAFRNASGRMAFRTNRAALIRQVKRHANYAKTSGERVQTRLANTTAGGLRVWSDRHLDPVLLEQGPYGGGNAPMTAWQATIESRSLLQFLQTIRFDKEPSIFFTPKVEGYAVPLLYYRASTGEFSCVLIETFIL